MYLFVKWVISVVIHKVILQILLELLFNEDIHDMFYTQLSTIIISHNMTSKAYKEIIHGISLYVFHAIACTKEEGTVREA